MVYFTYSFDGYQVVADKPDACLDMQVELSNDWQARTTKTLNEKGRNDMQKSLINYVTKLNERLQLSINTTTAVMYKGIQQIVKLIHLLVVRKQYRPTCTRTRGVFININIFSSL